MKFVIKMSSAWIAALSLGVLLTGCGGASDTVDAGAGSESPLPERAGAAVLSWSAPGERVNGDGIKMAELDKYIIRYGQNADELDQEAIIPDAQKDASMTHRVSGLEAGTWYFTIQVQDYDGLVSSPSEVVDKNIKS